MQLDFRRLTATLFLELVGRRTFSLSLDLLEVAFLIRNGFCWTWSLRGGCIHVGGSNASDMKLVLQREPRTG
jgi:hypothetical protein